MKTEEFFSELAAIARSNGYRFENIRNRLPLGVDDDGRIALSIGEHIENGAIDPFRHTCVTGTERTEFIRRLVLTLAGIYDDEQTTFLIVSPKREYSEFVRLTRADLFVPVIASIEELWKVAEFARSQAKLRQNAGRTPYGKLFFVLDGLETLANGSLEVYLPFFKYAVDGGAEIITGVDLASSSFASSPASFVGAGNCLVTVMDAGEADVSYVREDCSLALPKPFSYPDETDFSEAIAFVNGL